MTTSLTGNTGAHGPSGYGSKKPKGYNLSSVQRYTPEMMEMLNKLYGQVGEDTQMSKLARGDEDAFTQMEAPAMRNFAALQGGIASRFSGGNGALSSRRSSSFQNAGNQAASNFAQDIQGRRLELQNQANRDLFNMRRELLENDPNDHYMTPKTPKSNTAGGLVGAGLGGVAGFFAGGPMGAATGAKMGYDYGSGGSSNQGFQSSGNKDWGYEAANYFSPGI